MKKFMEKFIIISLISIVVIVCPFFVNFVISFDTNLATPIINKNQEIWVLFLGGYLGTIFGSLIGGYISYKIIKYQIKKDSIEKFKQDNIKTTYYNYCDIKKNIFKITSDYRFFYTQLFLNIHPEEKINQEATKLVDEMLLLTNDIGTFSCHYNLLLSSIKDIANFNNIVLQFSEVQKKFVWKTTITKEDANKNIEQLNILRNLVLDFDYKFAKEFFKDIFVINKPIEQNMDIIK